MKVNVIGAGLAGSEAAWQLLKRGCEVALYEMKPQKFTPAHHMPGFAELVCSNSLRSDRLENAVGLLKEEMRRVGSLIMDCAEAARVPAGGAMAVDREKFSAGVTAALRSHPLCTVVEGEVTALPEGPTIIATGPLTSDAFAQAIVALTGQEGLSFYDAAAPIVTLENDTFYADDNGNYTITGITEPGATIEVGGSSTEADENGEFSFTSTLPNDLTSMLVTVTATDAAGNSGTGSALITTIPDGTGDPDDPEPSDPDTGGKTTYSPTITDTENGTVSVSPSRPTRGQTVTITAEPDDGYVVDKVTVTDRNGNQVRVTDNGDGTYSFTQPSSVVTIEVTFRAAGSVSDCPGDETCPMAQFTDLNMDLWYHDGIHYCLENGLMNGVGNALFAPNGTITRAQIATIIYRLEGEPAVTDGSAFTDVADGTWYTDAVAWAAANEIMGGYGNGLFGPNDPITREQFAATLYRYAQYKGYDVSISENTNIQSFADFDAISEYAITAMQWTFDKGIITGISATTLEPQGIATRAQAAAMLQRFCENVVQ